MTCLKCGHNNDREAPWCERCLNEFPSSLPRYLSCPHCRQKNDPDATHCETCHEPLRPGQSE